MTRRIDAYATCFAAIDRHCPDPTALGQELLLGVFGAEGLRRYYLIVRFLIGRFAFDWDPGRTEAFIEVGRIEAVLTSSDERPWSPALRAYRDQLARSPTLRLKTVRVYLNAAAGLLARVGYADPTLIKRAEVDRYLRDRPGQRASLTPFFTYIAASKVDRLTALRWKRRPVDPKTREMALLQNVQHLLDRLDQPGSIGEGRAVLAAAISKLYLLPVTKVLSLKAADVAAQGDTITLWPTTTSVQLTPLLSNVFKRRVSWQGDYLFPGRNSAQPLSRDAVRHHLAGRRD